MVSLFFLCHIDMRVVTSLGFAQGLGVTTCKSKAVSRPMASVNILGVWPEEATTALVGVPLRPTRFGTSNPCSKLQTISSPRHFNTYDSMVLLKQA